LKTEFDSESKEKQKLLKLKAKLEQDLQQASNKSQQDQIIIQQVSI
jgi:hypothetical protein